MIPPASSPPDTAALLLALGKRIRLLRLTGELTQDELAAKAGMSRSFVSLIEHGRHGIDVARLARLAAALDEPLSTLIREAELRTEPKERQMTEDIAYRRAVAKRIRVWRAAEDSAQDELAVAAGVTRNFVSAVERGAVGLDAVRLRRLATAMQMPLADLLADPPRR